jgi:hypothetical protein
MHNTVFFSVLLLCKYFAMLQVVKYWKAKGQSGFYVWRYLLRRDDPEPAPWHKVTWKQCSGFESVSHK